METWVSLLALVASVLTWWAIARYGTKREWPGWARHVAGFIIGLSVLSLFSAAFMPEHVRNGAGEDAVPMQPPADRAIEHVYLDSMRVAPGAAYGCRSMQMKGNEFVMCGRWQEEKLQAAGSLWFVRDGNFFAADPKAMALLDSPAWKGDDRFKLLPARTVVNEQAVYDVFFGRGGGDGSVPLVRQIGEDEVSEEAFNAFCAWDRERGKLKAEANERFGEPAGSSRRDKWIEEQLALKTEQMFDDVGLDFLTVVRSILNAGLECEHDK